MIDGDRFRITIMWAACPTQIRRHTHRKKNHAQPHSQFNAPKQDKICLGPSRINYDRAFVNSQPLLVCIVQLAITEKLIRLIKSEMETCMV